MNYKQHPELYDENYPVENRIKHYVAVIEERLANEGYPLTKQQLTNTQTRKIFKDNRQDQIFNYYLAITHADLALSSFKENDMHEYTKHFELLVRELNNSRIPFIRESAIKQMKDEEIEEFKRRTTEHNDSVHNESAANWERWKTEANRIRENSKSSYSTFQLAELVKKSLTLTESVETIRKRI